MTSEQDIDIEYTAGFLRVLRFPPASTLTCFNERKLLGVLVIKLSIFYRAHNTIEVGMSDGHFGFRTRHHSQSLHAVSFVSAAIKAELRVKLIQQNEEKIENIPLLTRKLAIS